MTLTKQQESNIKYSAAFNEPVNLDHNQYIKLRTDKILEGAQHKKPKGFIARKLSSSVQDPVEKLVNLIEEKSMWQKFGL